MNICDDGHEEIVFSSKACPLCEAQVEIEEHEKQNDNLRVEIESLRDKVQALEML
jgi:hypothetical protein